jgi:hypothetical protein
MRLFSASFLALLVLLGSADRLVAEDVSVKG